jgi:hypothetical protein
LRAAIAAKSYSITHTKPKQKGTMSKHSITFAPSSDEIEVVVRGELGHYTRAIARATGLSESQVQYRLTKAGVLRRTYREGGSQISRSVLRAFRGDLSMKESSRLYPRFKPDDEEDKP